MSRWSGAGMFNYEKCLADAKEKGLSGIHLHLRRQTEPTSRLAFRGKKVSKKSLPDIAQSLQEAAEKNPSLKPYANNMAKYLPASAAKKKTVNEVDLMNEIIKLREKESTTIKTIMAPMQPLITATKVSSFESDDSKLREKIRQEALNKVAKALDIPQYGRRVYLKTKNSPG